MNHSIAPYRALPAQALVLCLSLLVGGACDDDPTGPGPSPVGIYQLVQMSGQPLPFVIIADGLDRLEITGGTLTLDADGTCLAEIELTTAGPTDSTTTVGDTTCTWTRDGNTLTLTYPDGDTDSASWSGDTVTIRGLGVGATMTFRR